MWALAGCRYHCGERVPRCQLAEHEQDVCPQRPVDVKLESFTRKMEERHMREIAAVKESHRKEMVEKEQMMERKLAEQDRKIKVINYAHLDTFSTN